MIDRSSHIRTALRRSQRGYLLDPYRFGSAAPAQAWDPANKDADITLSAADQLATIVSALGTVRSVTSHAAAGANHYGEIEIARTDTAGRPVALVGIVTAGVSLTNTYPGGTANSGSTQARSIYTFPATSFDAEKYSGNTPTSYQYVSKTVGVELNNGVLTFWLGGVSQGTAYSGLTGTIYLGWGPGTAGAGTRTCTMNSAGSFKFKNAAPGATVWGGTWDSAAKDADVTLSGADLIASVTTAAGAVRGTAGVAATGHFYAELTIGGSDANQIAGVMNSSAALTNSYPGADANGWSYYLSANQKLTNNTGTSNYQTKEVVGLLLSGGALYGVLDGELCANAYSSLTDTFFLAFGPGTGTGTFTGRINTGQSAFAFDSQGASSWG